MNYRTLGCTALKVSEIGYGAWGISKAQWIGAEDEESLRSLKAARDAGVNFFDTALAYGDGHSEQLISRAFGKSPDIIIASKVPPMDRQWGVKAGSPLQRTFPKKFVLDSLDQSLKNLGRDAVDVYQFHTWIDDWATNTEWQETVHAMKQSGKSRFIGISIQNHQPENILKALETGLVDTVQVIHNIFDQSPEDVLFPYAEKNNVGIIVRVPFDEGALTGKVNPDTRFPEGDFRNMYFEGNRKRDVWDRIQGITEGLNIDVSQMPEYALRYILAQPAVSTIIPGMRSTSHVGANTSASDKGPLAPSIVQQLHRHRWVRDYYTFDKPPE
jgi:aryl-alcohol dehydrogenase-like predicted oxidoreductase